jgi:hypothetical protein
LLYEALLEDHEPKHKIMRTSICASHIGSMSQGRVVKLITVGCHHTLITNTHTKPVACAFINLEGNRAGFVTFLLQGWLEQAEMVVVCLCRFNDRACMFQLGTEFKVYL